MYEERVRERHSVTDKRFLLILKYASLILLHSYKENINIQLIYIHHHVLALALLSGFYTFLDFDSNVVPRRLRQQDRTLAAAGRGGKEDMCVV